MENNKWTQARQTKIGRVEINISSASSTISAWVADIAIYNEECTTVTASSQHKTLKDAYYWSYGIKQSLCDMWAAFYRDDSNLIRTHAKEGQRNIVTIATALIEITAELNNFALPSSSGTSSDKISLTKMLVSEKLTDQDKAMLQMIQKKYQGIAVPPTQPTQLEVEESGVSNDSL